MSKSIAIKNKELGISAEGGSAFGGKNQKQRQGLTLLELMIVVAITIFISTYLVQYGSRGRAQVTLFIEHSKLVQILFRAKSLTLSTYNRPSVPCAYGIHINYGGQTYELRRYATSTCSGITDLSGISTVIETFALDPTVQFAASSTRFSDILFFPPEPTTLVWMSDTVTSSVGYVYVQTKDGGATRAISVSAAGQISY